MPESIAVPIPGIQAESVLIPPPKQPVAPEPLETEGILINF
jgi:hypothetical protein